MRDGNLKKKEVSAKFLIESNNDLKIEGKIISCEKGVVKNIACCNNHFVKQNEVMIPFFFNMHSHLGESIFKDISGCDWTIKKYLDYTENHNNLLTREAREEEWINSARDSARIMYQHGTIGFCAARSSGIAKEYGLLTMSGYPIMNSSKLLKFKLLGIDGFKQYKNENVSLTGSVGVFLHSLYSNDCQSLELAQQCMEEGASFITVHISEDEYTLKLEKEKFHKSAIETLDSFELLTEKSILVHCGYCTDEDLDLIKKRNSTICICPISNKFLNTCMPNIYKLEEKKINWCIGTDGLGTGKSFSLLDQLYQAINEYPEIPLSRYWASITSVPAKLFNNVLYSGTLSLESLSSFLLTDYCGTDPDELIRGLIERRIGFKPFVI